MNRALLVGWLGVIGLVGGWGCGSDDAGGGSGGTAGAAGSGGAAGSAGSGGTAGSSAGAGGAAGGGAGGSSAGTGGDMDGGMEASLDVYIYLPCQEACGKVEQPCNYTPMELEDCIQGCTTASLGMCGTELKAFVACVNGAAQVECTEGNPTAAECGAEAQAFGQCEST